MARHKNTTTSAWQKHQTNLLVEEIESVLSSFAADADFYNLLKEPLSVKRRGLAPQAAHDSPWHLLPIIVCESICGDFKRALPVGVAIQLMITAGDVFDDVEDNDSPKSLCAGYGLAISINAATTLMIMAERSISRLKARGVADNIIIRSYNALNSYYSVACVGQHLDLSTPQSPPISEDRYLKISSMKSASQIECACHLGALIGTTDNSIIEAYSAFGHNLGMAAQIVNDILGINDGKDIARRKITLPVLYALNNANKKTLTELEGIYINRSEEEPNIEQARDLLYSSGAMFYAGLKKELYKQKASDNLSRIADAGITTERIELFLK